MHINQKKKKNAIQQYNFQNINPKKKKKLYNFV